MKQGEEAVAILLDALNALELEYIVVGSFSSNRYGVPRATNDADFVLRIVAAERERLYAALPPSFVVNPQVSFEMVTGTWRQIIEVPEIPFLIEMFELSADAHDQIRFARRRKLILLSRESWLPTPEDVIVQKLRWSKAAMRTKDFEDAVAVMSVQGEVILDWSYIEHWCSQHGTMEVLQQAKATAAVTWQDDFLSALTDDAAQAPPPLPEER